jgi:hypothetical protein
VEEFVKRIRLLVVAGVIAAALPIGISAAGATGSPPPPNSVTIQQYADYDAAGLVLDVGLYVTCKGDGTMATNGLVDVQVEQYPPQTPYPVGFGSGPQSVVCDNRPHAVGVTVGGEGFDAGRAKATATFIPGLGGGNGVEKVKWITIVVV